MAGRILVLDDEENYAEMLQDLLREHNYRVDMATRPERAIVQLEEIPYDLVISDYKMPVMDGSDFLRKARELYPNLPFILVSGLMNTPELVKVANLNVTLVMEKPLETEVFLQHVARFTNAMTPEEKEKNSWETAKSEAAQSKISATYPKEPLFFSAGCSISKSFLQNAWRISQESAHLFILEPRGGDAALAVKDVSVWRGNLDKPVQEFSFNELVTEVGVARVEGLLLDSENSHVFIVRLSAADQIRQVQGHLSKLLSSIAAPEVACFVYILTDSISHHDFLESTGPAGCVLPELRLRTTDIALYAKRIARLIADRSATPKVAEFSADVVFALLAYEWPENYEEIYEVVCAAVQRSEPGPITLVALEDEIGGVMIPPPDERLAVFVKNAQYYAMDTLLSASGESVADLARDLELGSGQYVKADLKRIPLINPKLAIL